MRMTRRVRIALIAACALGAVWIVPTIIPQAQSALGKGYEHIKILIDVIDLVQNNYVDEVNIKTLVYGAAAGIVKTLDPFSQFMEPQAHKNLKVETEGKFGGLGIRIAIREEWLTVITPLLGTPAYRQGIMPNDKIIEIEGVSTRDITLEDAVEKLRGKPGTKVTITLVSKGAKEPQQVTITRAMIKIESVHHRMLDSSVGYVHLIEFSKNTNIDMRAALTEMHKRGMRSIVIDLRNNPGGLLGVAVDVCNEFLVPGKLIVYTQGRDPSSRQDFIAQREPLFPEMPVVVLVNRGSASGSEIVAGAMQDHRRALLIGSETFGKASVQSVIPLSDGSGLRLTTARYYTPSGRSIHREEKTGKGGIDPDIVIDVSREDLIALRAQNELIYAKGKKPSSQVDEAKKITDVVLERAVQILTAKQIFDGIGGSPAGSGGDTAQHDAAK